MFLFFILHGWYLLDRQNIYIYIFQKEIYICIYISPSPGNISLENDRIIHPVTQIRNGLGSILKFLFCLNSHLQSLLNLCHVIINTISPTHYCCLSRVLIWSCCLWFCASLIHSPHCGQNCLYKYQVWSCFFAWHSSGVPYWRWQDIQTPLNGLWNFIFPAYISNLIS